MVRMSKTLLDGFDILTFFENSTDYLQKIGFAVMMLVGVILVIVAVIQIAKGLAGGGKGQVNWVMSIMTLLVGGALMFGGWKLVTKVASAGADTINQLGGGDSIAGDKGGFSNAEDFEPAS